MSFKSQNHNDSSEIKKFNGIADKTDSLNLYSIGDQFVGSRECRLRVFGNLCNYFCAILCFVNFLKISVVGGGGGGGGWVWPYH